ncbi:DinB family protein [Paenibacillus humicus]|uniref:DinB family protein n=1 Tax=Paenibacillus humicus TaxID=412861 RepID=UPI000FDB844F|nr:DUF1572 family protein [Paenibacillus humicus]
MLEWIKYTLEDMDKQLQRILKSLNHLDEEQIWQRLKSSTNSIGNLCLHLAGNEYQSIASSIGGKPFIRERSKEFTAEGGRTKKELGSLLVETRAESTIILSSLTGSDLGREVRIVYRLEDWNRMLKVQADAETAFETREIGRLLIQVAAHYGYHAGQIVLLSKLHKDIPEPIAGQYH